MWPKYPDEITVGSSWDDVCVWKELEGTFRGFSLLMFFLVPVDVFLVASCSDDLMKSEDCMGWCVQLISVRLPWFAMGRGHQWISSNIARSAISNWLKILFTLLLILYPLFNSRSPLGRLSLPQQSLVVVLGDQIESPMNAFVFSRWNRKFTTWFTYIYIYYSIDNCICIYIYNIYIYIHLS